MKIAEILPNHPQPVVHWQEGMLLLPQHFQWQNRQLMQYAFDLHRILDPHRWGIGRLEFNMPALERGVVELVSFSALFPDGAWVSLGENAVVDSRYVLEEIDSHADLFVGLQCSDHSPANTGLAGQGAKVPTVTGRYTTAAVSVEDVNAPDSPGEIEVLNYRLGLYLSNEPQVARGHDLIRIARVRVSGGGLQLDDTYIPPLLAVSASRNFQIFIRNLMLWLEQRRWQLQLTSSINDGVLRQTVYRCLGNWPRWISNEPVSPYQVFREILGVAREVAFVQAKGGAAYLLDTKQDPEYDHRDIAGSLARAVELLRNGFENTLGVRVRELDLNLKDDIWGLDLDEESVAYMAQARRLMLLIDAGESISSTQILAVSKLASRTRLPELVAHALPGLPMSAAGIAPGYGADAILELSTSGVLWQEIVETRSLALYVENPPPRLRARLLLIFAEEGV